MSARVAGRHPVVDLTNVIAGPTIGSTLARYGARVVEGRPTGTNLRSVEYRALWPSLQSRETERAYSMSGSDLGRVARSTTPGPGRRPHVQRKQAQLARLGLDRRRLRQSRTGCPSLSLGRLERTEPVPGARGPATTTWCRPQPASRPASAGAGNPEEHAHFGTIDVLAGLAAAASLAFALYARDSTGRVMVARRSLVAAGQLIQAPYMCSHGGPGLNEPAGRETRGEGPLYRSYATRNGWAFVVVPPERLNDLARVLEVEPLDDIPRDKQAAVLAQALRENTSEHWQQALTSLGITVQPLETLSSRQAKHSATGHAPWSDSSYHFTTRD